MKKKLIIVSIIIIALILLIPIPMKLKDGGSIEFKAILYKITKYHRLSSTEEDVKYIDGIAIEIPFSFEKPFVNKKVHSVAS